MLTCSPVTSGAWPDPQTRNFRVQTVALELYLPCVTNFIDLRRSATVHRHWNTADSVVQYCTDYKCIRNTSGKSCGTRICRPSYAVCSPMPPFQLEFRACNHVRPSDTRPVHWQPVAAYKSFSCTQKPHPLHPWPLKLDRISHASHMRTMRSEVETVWETISPTGSPCGYTNPRPNLAFCCAGTYSAFETPR